MFTLDLIIKYSPMPISIQKNEEEEAKTIYQNIVNIMGGDHREVVELTCDKQKDKKIAILSSEITSIILSEKTGGGTSDRVTGFFAALSDNK